MTSLLYNAFPSRNLIRREGKDVMVLIITSPFFLARGLLSRTCDDFPRQKTFVLKILFVIPLF